MKFGFDIDDTLINLREHAFNLYNEKLNMQIGIEHFHALTTIPIHEPFGMSKEEGGQMWNDNREEIYFSECPPFPDAVEVLQELVHQGHEIYYITARASAHCQRTLAWLVQAGFPVKKEHFYCGMGDTEKVHIIKSLQLDYYFDDKPAVLDTLGELSLQVYVKDNSYNKHVDIPRIASWRELLDIVKSDTRSDVCDK